MGIINFNGKASDELNVVVEYFPNYKVPQKQYKTVDIPGRNGSYLVDLGTYSNVERSYEIAIADKEFKNDFSAMVNPVVEWLCSANGYCKLYDSYDQDYYRYAIYKGDTEFANILNLAGRSTISFDCKPEKYLLTGDITQTIHGDSKDTIIYNPTSFASKPLFKIYGSGSGYIVLNNHMITISDIDEYMYIDCDTKECYKGYDNIQTIVEQVDSGNVEKLKEVVYFDSNDNITFDEDTLYIVNGENTQNLSTIQNRSITKISTNNKVNITEGFPTLIPGENNIRLYDGVTKMEVLPRWWTI